MYILIPLWRSKVIQLFFILTFLFLQLLITPNVYAFELNMLNEVYDQDNVPINFQKLANFICGCLQEVNNITCGEYESVAECKQRRQLFAKSCWKYTRKWYISRHNLSLKYYKNRHVFESYSLDFGGYSHASFEKQKNSDLIEKIHFGFKTKWFDKRYFDNIEVTEWGRISFKSKLQKARLLKTREKYLEFRALMFYDNCFFKSKWRCKDNNYLYPKYLTLYDTVDKRNLIIIERDIDYSKKKLQRFFIATGDWIFTPMGKISFEEAKDIIQNDWYSEFRDWSECKGNNFLKNYYEPSAHILTNLGLEQ